MLTLRLIGSVVLLMIAMQATAQHRGDIYVFEYEDLDDIKTLRCYSSIAYIGRFPIVLRDKKDGTVSRLKRNIVKCSGDDVEAHYPKERYKTSNNKIPSKSVDSGLTPNLDKRIGEPTEYQATYVLITPSSLNDLRTSIDKLREKVKALEKSS